MGNKRGRNEYLSLLVSIIGRVVLNFLLGANDGSQILLSDAAIAELPGAEGVSTFEDLFDLLERTSSGFWEHEQNVDECNSTEASEQEVGLESDGLQGDWGEESEGGVERPVTHGRDGDGLGADSHGEDLGGVSPGDGTNERREGADAEIGADDDGICSALVANNNPNELTVRVGGVIELPLSESGLNTTDEAEEDTHASKAGQQHGTTTPFVDPENGGNGEAHVEDVLNRGSDQTGTSTNETGATENVENVVHHDVHSGHLGPDLKEETQEDTTEDTGLEEIQPRFGTLGTLESNGLHNFVVFELNELILSIALAVKIGQDLESFVIAVVINQPTRRFREPHHSEGKDDSGDDLKTPGETERGLSVDVRATELNEVLNQDSPGDGPLLKRDKTATDGGCGDLSLIEGDDGGGDTDSHASNDTASDEHTAINGGALKNATNNPEPTRHHDGALAAEYITEESSDEGAKERASRHSGYDCTLDF